MVVRWQFLFKRQFSIQTQMGFEATAVWSWVSSHNHKASASGESSED